MSLALTSHHDTKPRKQIAALPVKIHADGQPRVLLITSRETKRFIIPKGWPMKGKKDHEVAALEARQEAGIIGRIEKKPIGQYDAWKRLSDHFDFCHVKVYLLEFERQLPNWDEKGQRQSAWLSIGDAVTLIDEPGLNSIVKALPVLLPERNGNASPR